MSDATAIEITTQGRTLRFGHDVPDARGIPFGLTYSSTLPGGHATCSFNLRVPIIEEASFGLLDLVRVYAVKGNVTLWDGFVSRLPRQSGDDVLLQVQCVGRSAEMSWQTGFRELYVDRDLSRWQGPSRQRQSNLIGVNAPHQQDATPTPDLATGLPSLRLFIQGVWASPWRPRCETWYDAGAGCEVESMYYDFSGESGGSTAFELFASVHSDDVATAGETSADLYTALTGEGTYTPATPRRWADWYWDFNSAPGGTDGITYSVDLRSLAVFGNNGLTKRGDAPDQGYYGHDVLADIISRAAPRLTYTTGPDGSIEDNTSCVLGQLTFPKPTTAADALLELNKYFLWEWGVWDGGEFFWRPADPDRLCWEARLDEGLQIQLEGDEADNALNGVIVNYRLPDGTEKVAGPVGSGFDVEDAALGDTSVENTVNEHGIARKWAQLDLSFPTSDAGAVQIGFVYLAQLSFPARKGQITLTGTVKHPTKGRRPVGEIRAGDWIKVPGHSDVARRIVQANHTPDQRQCTVDVGNDVEKVDAILQRVGVQTSRITG